MCLGVTAFVYKFSLFTPVDLPLYTLYFVVWPWQFLSLIFVISGFIVFTIQSIKVQFKDPGQLKIILVHLVLIICLVGITGYLVYAMWAAEVLWHMITKNVNFPTFNIYAVLSFFIAVLLALAALGVWLARRLRVLKKGED